VILQITGAVETMTNEQSYNYKQHRGRQYDDPRLQRIQKIADNLLQDTRFSSIEIQHSQGIALALFLEQLDESLKEKEKKR
jgi:Flp pilus assembly protein TadB